jgi:hypothetical protein
MLAVVRVGGRSRIRGGDAGLLASPAASAGYDEDVQRCAAAKAEREASRILILEKERLSGRS